MEVSPASMVNPETAIVIAPAITFTAGRAAALAGHHGFTVNVTLAVVAVAIIGRAGKLHGFVRSAPIIAVTIIITVVIPVPVAVMVPVMVAIPIPVVIAG